jgi:hypothetical protein
MSGLTFILDDGHLVTQGFASIERPELSIALEHIGTRDDAQDLLLSLSGIIVSCGWRLEAGAEIENSDCLLRLHAWRGTALKVEVCHHEAAPSQRRSQIGAWRLRKKRQPGSAGANQTLQRTRQERRAAELVH